jgi:hypothetical protein
MAKGGSNYGAGIGGGSDGSAGKIKILGGTVIGIGGSANAAGVGGGDGGSGDGSIAISGGTVIANQKGIGITNIGSAVTTISGNAVVLATGISAATGSGIANTATAIYGTTNITLSASIATAGTITLAANQAIKENTELTVPKGWTLTTNGKTLTNEGAITNEGTVTNANANGTIVNKGAITNEGTITNTNASSAIINEGTVTNNGTITNTNGVIVNYGTADGSGAWPAFYDVNVTFDNKIDAEGYISSATYNNVPIRNGAKVAGTNKALVITAADRRESADTTYAWSGDGTNNVTTPTLTISNLAAALDATCEISGTDTITPTLTPGEVIRTSDTDASVSFTASEAGEYYYEAVDDNTDEPTIDTSEAGAAFTWEDLTITIHPDSITAGAKDVYIKAKDKAIAGNNVSDALKITIPAYAPPELTKGEVIRASETEATVEFTSDKDGKYYYSVVEHGEEAPDIDVSGNGTDITENAEASISLDELTSGAKDVYIKVKTTVDSVSMVSPALKISIIEVLQPELTGGNQKLTLAPQTAEAGYAFYYAHDTQSAAQPQFGDAISSITEATAYTAEAVITNLTNDAAHYVQLYKVETTGNTIVGYGEASETPEAGESPEPEKPTVTVTATPETEAEYGENVTFTATVSNGTGTVQFKDGALDLGSAVNISEGTAEYETSELGVGEHSITAVYSGDNNYSEATSSALTYNIIGAAPEITGAATKSVTYGYEAASSGMLTITGNPAPTVTKQSGDAKITWNATTKKLDIKSGLAAGIYPVEIKASNGVNPDDIFTFTLTVDKAAASIIAHPAAKTDLAYTGNPQNLLSVSGSTADGALKFAVTAKGAAAPNDSAYTDAAEATNAGDYTVWYKIFGDENHDDSAPLYINVTITKNEDIKVSSVNITGAPEKFAYKASGKNNTLSLSVNVSAATNMGVTWSSSSPAIATVDQNGLVTFKGAEGPVIITAGANDGSNISHSVTITAYKNVGAPVTTLKTIYLTKGKSYTPPIVMYDGGAEVKAKIAWKTSDAKTAKVNKSTGKITVPKKPKKTKATITGTTLGGKKIVIKVNIAKKSLKLKKATIKAPKKLKPKKTGKITVKLVQSKATNISIIFKSSKASGLYVNKVGKITAKKKGNYTVTVSAGGKKYKVKIAVK